MRRQAEGNGMQYSWLAVLAGLPLILAPGESHAAPPVQPPQAASSPLVVQVNFLDRLLQDNTKRKRPSSTKRRTRNSQQNKAPVAAAVPAVVPAVIPVPTPKPGTASDPTPDTVPAATAVETPVPEEAPATPPTPAPADVPAPEPAPVPAPAAATDQPPAPTVEQPATAVEPAHEAEVPKPLPKPPEAATTPETTTPDVKPDAPAPAEPKAADQPAADKPAADQPASDTEEAKPAEPPPMPIAKEDPEELKACLADLSALGTKFTPIPSIDDGQGCGIDKPIEVAQVLPDVDLGGAIMRCKTAQALGHWLKDTVQPALNIAIPGRRITGIVPGSTYACRLRNSASAGKISEHARGNGFDVAAFKLDNGEKMELKPRMEDSTMEGAFQRTATAGACLHFTTVLSPGSDETHEDHLHLDVIERKGGYRYCR
jgi:hypothetical protein